MEQMSFDLSDDHDQGEHGQRGERAASGQGDHRGHAERDR
jgi:hypothetical protein